MFVFLLLLLSSVDAMWPPQEYIDRAKSMVEKANEYIQEKNAAGLSDLLTDRGIFWFCDYKFGKNDTIYMLMNPPVGKIKMEYVRVRSSAYMLFHVDIHAVGYGFDVIYSLDIKKEGDQFKIDGGNACNRKFKSELPIGNGQFFGKAGHGLEKLRNAAKDVTEQFITSLKKAIKENDKKEISRHFSDQFRLKSCTGILGKKETMETLLSANGIDTVHNARFIDKDTIKYSLLDTLDGFEVSHFTLKRENNVFVYYSGVFTHCE